MMWGRGWGILVAALVLAGAGRAQAYVRSVGATGMPICWPQAHLKLVLAAGAPPAGLDHATLIAAVQAAAAAWSRGAVSCTQLAIEVEVSEAARADAVADGTNQITFRQDTWGRQPCPNGACAYDPAELVRTSVYERGSDGVIIGGDIEINAINFRWADVTKPGGGPGSGAQDLQNALTHELGHLIGLGHTCASPGERVALDHRGQQIPPCGAGSPSDVQGTTMYAGLDPGEITKRDLAPDDIEGVCALFPAGRALPCMETPDAGADAGAGFEDGGQPDARAVDAGASFGFGDGPLAPGGGASSSGCAVSRRTGATGALPLGALLLVAGVLAHRRRARARP